MPYGDSRAELFAPPLGAANCEEDGPGQRVSRSILLAMDWKPRHLGLLSPEGRWPTFHSDSAAHWTGLKTAVHKAFPWVRCISLLLSAFPGAVTTPCHKLETYKNNESLFSHRSGGQKSVDNCLCLSLFLYEHQSLNSGPALNSQSSHLKILH